MSVFYFHLVCSCQSWFTPPFDQSVVAEIGRHWHNGHNMRQVINDNYPCTVSTLIVARDMLEKHMINVGCVQYISSTDWPVYKSKLDAPVQSKWDTNRFWENNWKSENDDLADAFKYSFRKGRDKW